MTDTQDLFSQIARTHLGIETLECRNRDSLDFHEVAVASLRSALAEAYEAGTRAGAAIALNVTHAVHDDTLQRFAWQVFLRDGRCVLVTATSDDHRVIPSRYEHADDHPYSVPLHAIPLDILERVRLAIRETSP
jgi:hypothetical protein